MEDNVSQNINSEFQTDMSDQEETDQEERAQQNSRHRRIEQRPDNSGHILEVLRAAMPYIDSRRQHSMETIMKATDLIHTTRNASPQVSELSAASLNSKAADLEGMLCSVREVGSPMERDLIDKMLNYFKAKKLYQTYQMFQQNKDVLRAASIGNQGPYNSGNNVNFTETLKSMLSPDQAASIDNFQMMLNAMNMMGMMNNRSNNNYSNNYGNNYSNNYANNANAYNPGTTSDNVPPYTNYNPSYESSQATANGYSYAKTSDHSQTSSMEHTWTPPNNNTSIPNYTYQMNTNTQQNNSPVVDENYLNQFAPTMNAQSTTSSSSTWNDASQTSSTVQSSDSTSSNKSDQANMNNIYQNISNIFYALNAAGLNPNNNSAPNMNSNSMNQAGNNNMLNAISALANSGLLNNNRTSPNTSASTSPVSNAIHQTNMRSMPIPTANDFNNQQSTSSTNRAQNSYSPNNLYQRANNSRTMNTRNQYSSQSSKDNTLEAASLDS